MYYEIEQGNWSGNGYMPRTSQDLREQDKYPAISRCSFTPPRLQTVDPAMTQPIPHLVMADLHFPAELVRQRATTYANTARLNGARHSLRLWRKGYEQALIALARQATDLPSSAVCQALFWEQKQDDFYVSATFSQAPNLIAH